jgi:catechol O-methyltransferase
VLSYQRYSARDVRAVPAVLRVSVQPALLTTQGTVLVADNVVKPGNPAYLSYVRATPAQKREALSLPVLTTQPPTTPNPPESDWETAFKDGPIEETRWAPDEAEGIRAKGVPDLKYGSRMLDGWDPYTGEKDACEVSVCEGRE